MAVRSRLRRLWRRASGTFLRRAATGYIAAFVLLLIAAIALDATNASGPDWAWQLAFVAAALVEALIVNLWAFHGPDAPEEHR